MLVKLDVWENFYRIDHECWCAVCLLWLTFLFYRKETLISSDMAEPIESETGTKVMYGTVLSSSGLSEQYDRPWCDAVWKTASDQSECA